MKRNILREAREARDRGRASLTSAGAVSRDKRASYPRTFTLRTGNLGFSNAISAGDAIRQELIDQIESAAQHGPVRILVQDGKPLTPEGEALLRRTQ